MYQVFIKAKSIEELQEAVENFNMLVNRKDIEPLLKSEVELPRIKDQVIDKMNEEPEIAEALIPVAPQKVVVSNDAELDSEGLPWDKRIHGMGKSKVKDGTWRLKRGVEQDLVNQVKNELRASLNAQANPTPIPPAPVQAQTPVVEIPTQPAPVQPAPLPTSNGHTFETFKTNFPVILGHLISEGKVTQEYINTLKQYFAVDEIWNINDEQKKEVFENFVQYGFITKVG